MKADDLRLIAPWNGRHYRRAANGDDHGIGFERAHKLGCRLGAQPHVHVRLLNLTLQPPKIPRDVLLVGLLGYVAQLASQPLLFLQQNDIMSALSRVQGSTCTCRAATYDHHTLGNLSDTHLSVTRDELLVPVAWIYRAAHMPMVGGDVIAVEASQARADVLSPALAGLGGPQRVSGQRTSHGDHVARAVGDEFLGLLGRLN